MNIYFISGLGADERAFEKLRLPKEWNCYYLGWPEPSNDDTLESYSKKFIPLIETKKEFILVGLSLGGMIVTELAKTLKPEKTIIVSSIFHCDQLPFMIRFLRTVNLVKFLPDTFPKKLPSIVYWFQGVKTKEEKELLIYFVKKSSPKFTKWAVRAIANWNNQIRPENLYHIHGDKDHIFPIKRLKPDYIIKGGGHFMIYSKAEEVSKAIINILQ